MQLQLHETRELPGGCLTMLGIVTYLHRRMLSGKHQLRKDDFRESDEVVMMVGGRHARQQSRHSNRQLDARDEPVLRERNPVVWIA
jgi:hypothetical protein